MSDQCIHIVPVRRGDYPDAEARAGKILDWFIARDLVEATPSNCILSSAPGYRFKPAITGIFDNWAHAQHHFDPPMLTFGLALHHGPRQVFHPMEGGDLTMTCPACGHAHALDDAAQFLDDWYKGTDDHPACLGCGRPGHIVDYHCEPEWGFSNLGITLWNSHWEPSQAFLDEMCRLYDAPAVRVVVVHI